jgi:hypothetical protein
MEDEYEATPEELAKMHWFTGRLLTEKEVGRVVRARFAKRADWAETRPGFLRDTRFYPTPERTWATFDDLADLDL